MSKPRQLMKVSGNVLKRQEDRARDHLGLVRDLLRRDQMEDVAQLAAGTFEVLLPHYREAAPLTPIDHHMAVAMHGCRIALSGATRDKAVTVVLTIGGMVHDVGLAEETEGKRTGDDGGDSRARVAQRLRHGQRSAAWLERSIAEDPNPLLTDEWTRRMLARLCREHDYPSVAKDLPRSEWRAHLFDPTDPEQVLLGSFRDADRLWMAGPVPFGPLADMVRDQASGKAVVPHERVRANWRKLEEERHLNLQAFPEKRDAFGFKAGTALFRTPEAQRLYLEYVELAQVVPEERWREELALETQT